MDQLNDLIRDWAMGFGETGELFVRLVLAALLGGLVGVEREIRGREAGFRTNMLVCLGSATIMIVSIGFARGDWVQTPGFNIVVDPARVAYGVMTGVGFLGAGAILKQDTWVRGLTTAAALWCVAAIGLAAGFGHYLVSILAALLVLASLWLLDFIEVILPRRQSRRITLHCAWGETSQHRVAELAGKAHVRIDDQSFHRLPDPARMSLRLAISFGRLSRYRDFERALEAEPTVDLVASERLY